MQLKGKINKDGHLVPDNLESVRNELIISFEDKEIEITIAKHKKSRTGKQNRWYWGVAVPTVQTGILNQSGILHDKDTIHALILSAVGGLQMETKMIMGLNVIEVKQKRTSGMSVEEFNQFYIQIQEHFAEKDILIPDPTQDNYFNQIAKWK